MEQALCPYQSDQTSKCQTNICHPTRFSSCKTSRTTSRKTSSWSCFRSTYPLEYTARLRLIWRPRYANLYEVRLIPTKKDIAFVEYLDEGSATVAKDALHNYKLDGENKIKVRNGACLPAQYRCSLLAFRLRSQESRRWGRIFALSVPSAIALLSLYSCINIFVVFGVTPQLRAGAFITVIPEVFNKLASGQRTACQMCRDRRLSEDGSNTALAVGLVRMGS